MKTGKLREEKEVLDRQQHLDLEALKNLEENLQKLRNQSSELDSQEDERQKRLKKIDDMSAKHKTDLTEQKKELRTLQENHRKSRSLNFLWYLFK